MDDQPVEILGGDDVAESSGCADYRYGNICVLERYAIPLEEMKILAVPIPCCSSWETWHCF